MKVQSTPGPWEQSGSIVYSPNNGVICELSEIKGNGHISHRGIDIASPDWDEAMANARLIAAAPDMLEALHHCHVQMMALANALNWDDVGQVYVDAINAARAAIAKVEGE